MSLDPKQTPKFITHYLLRLLANIFHCFVLAKVSLNTVNARLKPRLNQTEHCERNVHSALTRLPHQINDQVTGYNSIEDNAIAVVYYQVRYRNAYDILIKAIDETDKVMCFRQTHKDTIRGRHIKTFLILEMNVVASLHHEKTL